MPLLRSRLVLAFDASSVSAARLSWSSGPRIDSCARVPLAEGVLAPSAVAANLEDAEAILEPLRELRRKLGEPKDRPAILVLPCGVSRTALLDCPPDASPREYARFRLAQGLPYPAAEALVDVVVLGRGRLVGAAVRRSIVAEYEHAASAAGWVQERLDLAPLAALDGLHRGGGAAGAGVDVILGDVALSFAAHRDGEVLAFRSRLRDPEDDEAERIQAEAERTAIAAGLSAPRIRVVGPGARALVHALSFRGLTASPGWDAPAAGLPAEPCELAWLGAAQ